MALRSVLTGSTGCSPRCGTGWPNPDASWQCPARTGGTTADYGRAASYTGMSIPGISEGVRAIGDAGRGQGAAEDAPDNKTLLALLLEDPTAELAGLKDPGDFQLEQAGFQPVPAEVETRNAALGAAEDGVSAGIVSGMTALGLSGSWSEEDIKRQVHDILDATAAADRTLGLPDLQEPMARAFTAAMYRTVTPAGDWPGEFPWNLAAALAEDALEGQFGGDRGKRINAAGSRALTYALRHGLRARIMPSLSLFLGDVMAWFRNRQQVLECLDAAATRAGTADPLVLVGHSLGGVIAFEYCAQASRDVTFLATVGSQVGFFGELGVLSPEVRLPDGKLQVPAS